jgi:hypothetical protein
MGRGSQRTAPIWGAAAFLFCSPSVAPAFAGEFTADSRCRGMNNVIACACALQNGGAIRLDFGQRRAVYPSRFSMDVVGKCIRDASGATAIVFSPSAAGDSQDCDRTRGRFADNGTQQRTMWVNRNKECDFYFLISKSDRGRDGIYSIDIVSHPRNGLLRTYLVRHLVYKPNLGFSGEDSFDLEVKYDRDDKVTFTHLHYTVAVR